MKTRLLMLTSFAVSLIGPTASAASVLTSSGDTYIHSSQATTNFGSGDFMVANDNGSYVRMAIFSFYLTSGFAGSLTSAKLELDDVIGNASQTYEIWGLLDAHEDFDESTLTWNTAGFVDASDNTTVDANKAFGGAALGTFSNTANSLNTVFDVTSGPFLNFLNASADGDVTFVIVDPDNGSLGSGWATKEDSGSNTKPTLTVQEDFTPEGVEHLRVVLFAGQSNTDGRAAPSGLPTSPVNLQLPQDDVDFFYRVESTIFPLTTLRPGLSETNGFGPAITCGRYLADELADGITTRLAAIKYANGGTNLHTQWAGGGDGTTSGDGSEYVRFQETVTAGLAALSSTYPNAVIELVGMVWLQGESDSGPQAVNYEANLTNFIADVRLTYGANLRIVVIRLSDGQTAVGSLATIRAAQTAVTDADPLTALVDSDGFGMKSDNLHFDALGQQQNGEASAIQLLNLYPFLSPPQIAPQPSGDYQVSCDNAFKEFLYTLESSTTLAPDSWQFEQSTTASGSLVNFTVSLAEGESRRFYRVERTLAP